MPVKVEFHSNLALHGSDRVIMKILSTWRK